MSEREITREEWLNARARLARAMRLTSEGLTRATEAILGPCPPEPMPIWKFGKAKVSAWGADGTVWIGEPDTWHENLSPDQADAMAHALRDCARWLREDGGAS